MSAAETHEAQEPERHEDEAVADLEAEIERVEAEASEPEAVEAELAAELDSAGSEPSQDETAATESEDSQPEPDPAHQAHLQSVLEDLRGQRQLEQSLEALLVSTRVPLTAGEIAEALQLEVAPVQEALERLERDLAGRALGLFHRDKQGQKAWILDIRAAYRADVAAVAPPLLKPAVTETLALIAINQPIPQARLVRERGSTVYDHVKELCERGLIKRGKSGRSYVLSTTDAFAAEFGLANDPGLIRRALAKAAGVEGTPEVIGSHRIHFDDEAKQDAASLAAEAQQVFDEQEQARRAEASARAARLQAALAEVDAEAAAPAAPAEPAPPAPAADLPRGLAAAPGPVRRIPSDAFDAAPIRTEDCVVSGGEPPVDPRDSAAEPQATPGATSSQALTPIYLDEEDDMDGSTPRQDEQRSESEHSSESSRLARLLAMTGDQNTTTDDW